MTRVRLATVLAVVAILAVLVSGSVAATVYLRQDGRARGGAVDQPAVEPLVVRDRATGATFEVPAGGAWEVEGPRVRIYYADARGRPAAVVRGPAVFRKGYCPAQPRDSNRAFAGFTRQDFRTWTAALKAGDGTAGAWSAGVDQRRMRLGDGTPARLWQAGILVGDPGPCSASEVEVAMVESGDLRVVLVSDAGDPGTLTAEEAAAILTSLRPGD